jgi:signal transduction histidine kinase
MQEAACVYDEAGHFETVNEYLAAFYDATSDELAGEQSNLVPMIRAESEGDPYQELLEGDREEIRGEVEGEFPGAGHEVLAYRLTPYVVDGEVSGVVGVAHEVTDQRMDRRELERTNALLSTLFETLPIGVLAEDADRDVLALNDRLLNLFEVDESPARLVGTDCDRLAAEVSNLFEDPERFVARVEELVATHKSAHDDALSLRDGRTFSREYRQIELANDEGHLWVYRDTTEREARERRLQRERDRLDEFASVVSHDLRNPLQVATASLDLAREECESEHHDRAATALDRMGRLIDDLLALARQGDDVSETDPVALPAAVRECWQNVAVGDATLVVETDRTVVADRSRLKQLLENLARNAVEHGSAADDPVTVTVGDLADGFYIADDGPGLPDGETEAVFEAGYTTSEDGTGFGLSIVERVAAAHAWSVRATESADGGARFEVTGVTFAED